MACGPARVLSALRRQRDLLGDESGLSPSMRTLSVHQATCARSHQLTFPRRRQRKVTFRTSLAHSCSSPARRPSCGSGYDLSRSARGASAADRATSCDFTKACSAERRREPVIKRDGRTAGAGVDRASIEHPCAVLAGPIDGACKKRRRDPLPAATRLGHEAGDAPHPRVVGWSIGRRRREATRAIPARHIGARTDLDPADRSAAPIGEQPGRRACLDARPEQLPRAGPKRRLEVAPRHAPVHAPAVAARAAPVAKHDFQIGPPGRRQRSDLDLRGTG